MTRTRRWRPSQWSRLDIVVMGRLPRVAPEHLSPVSEREDRHTTRQSKQPIGTKRFKEVVESTDFRKGTFLDLRQQPGRSEEHIPPLHSQVFEPPNLSEQLTGAKRQYRRSITEMVKTFRIE